MVPSRVRWPVFLLWYRKRVGCDFTRIFSNKASFFCLTLTIQSLCLLERQDTLIELFIFVIIFETSVQIPVLARKTNQIDTAKSLSCVYAYTNGWTCRRFLLTCYPRRRLHLWCDALVPRFLRSFRDLSCLRCVDIIFGFNPFWSLTNGLIGIFIFGRTFSV